MGLWLYGERVMKTWSILRLTMAVLILAAMVAEFRGAMSTTPAEGSSMATVVVNYFSYFTIESNLIAAAALIAAGVWALTRDAQEPTWMALLMAAATTFMAITGLVYNLLLRGLVPAAHPWANEILHLIGPLFLIIDLLVAPPRRRLPWRAVGAVVAFPIVWAIYTLVRGEHVVSPLTGDPWWYPYPFLNNHLHGYGVVFAYVVGIAAAFTLVAWGVVAVGRRRSPEAVADEKDAGLSPA
ncbi:Pr6Pr family membrane protein [Nocardioides sp. NBC_00163]|uniref:Pr6Pr family membrane protein n=1 Tax=Nocardioides sp. NBC_00163 TaxID=2975999 RepID=UPI00324AFB52